MADILITHPVRDGQANQVLVTVLRNRVFSAPVPKLLPIIRMKMDGNVMYVHSYVFPPKRTKNFSAVDLKFLYIQAYRVQMPGRFNSLAYAGKNQPTHPSKRLFVGSRNFAPPLQVLFQLDQLRKAKRARDIRQSIVKAQRHHFVEPLPACLSLPCLTRDAMIPEAAQFIGKLQ